MHGVNENDYFPAVTDSIAMGIVSDVRIPTVAKNIASVHVIPAEAGIRILAPDRVRDYGSVSEIVQ